MTLAIPSRELRRAIANTKREENLFNGPKQILLSAIDRVLDDKHMRAAKALSSGYEQVLHPRINAVLIKPVSDHCNLRCSYCYEGPEEIRHVSPRMTLQLLEKIISESIAQAQTSIDFMWHGGEPLLAGLPFFEKGVEFQQKHCIKDVHVSNAVQTNGLLLNKNWIDFFKKYNFSIGISHDGPRRIHNLKRIDVHGNGTSLAVENAIDLLRAEGMPFGVISVIDSNHSGIAKEYLEYMLNLGVRFLDIHPNVQLQNGMVKGIQSSNFSDFVIDLFNEWINSGESNLQINIFEDFLRGYFGLAPDTCYFSGNCGKIVAVESSGEVVSCTRPFDRIDYTFGNINHSTITEVYKSSRFELFLKRDEQAQANAMNCRWSYLCHNGCPQHRVDANGRQDVAGINSYCDCAIQNGGGYSRLWSHIENCLYELFLPN